MQRRAVSLFLAGGLLAPTAAAFGADEPTLVRVALLDMSVVMGPGGRGPGGWRGGPGMMGYGMGFGFGPPGADGGGRGPGSGPGWGPGMMGGGMMGGGMMGAGMMTIRADQSSVPAGKVRFEVTNWSRSVLHEMLIVAVDHAEASLPYDPTSGRVPEEQVRILGDTEDMQPNASKVLEATLAPGAYLLLCNLPGHYAAGMVTPLTVTR